jgi:PBP1b-binding outer membrane lipoprotein LpoB
MKKHESLIILTVLFAALYMSGCRSDQEMTDPQPPVNKNLNQTEIPPKDVISSDITDHAAEEIPKEYLKEGFIDRSTFRIVIIATREECLTDQQSIEKKSRNRSLATLQKYITSQGLTITRNTNSGLINIMNENGKFYRKNAECGKTNIYYFDIKKEGIKNNVLDTSRQR